MKVRELYEHLGKLDQELDVLCYCEDERLLTEKRGFALFDILDVRMTYVERLSLEDGTLDLKFKRGPNSDAMATLEITSDF